MGGPPSLASDDAAALLGRPAFCSMGAAPGSWQKGSVLYLGNEPRPDPFCWEMGAAPIHLYAVLRAPASAARAAALSVFSQVNSGSLRPKWPYEAVFS